MNLNIEIKGYIKDDVLILSVKDDGLGMKDEKAQALSNLLKTTNNTTNSHGLYNISRRLYLEYGKGSGIELRNEEDTGLEVIINVVQNRMEERNVQGSSC